MKFRDIFNPQGKQVFPRLGMVIPIGTIIRLVTGDFLTTEFEYIVRQDKTYADDMTNRMVTTFVLEKR